MSMNCKQCGESFPRNQPFDLFELRRHKLLPADADGMTHSDVIEDGGIFCSRKCVTDFLGSRDKSGVFDLAGIRKKMEDLQK
jgi:hypothetical protein